MIQYIEMKCILYEILLMVSYIETNFIDCLIAACGIMGEGKKITLFLNYLNCGCTYLQCRSQVFWLRTQTFH